MDRGFYRPDQTIYLPTIEHAQVFADKDDRTASHQKMNLETFQESDEHCPAMVAALRINSQYPLQPRVGPYNAASHNPTSRRQRRAIPEQLLKILDQNRGQAGLLSYSACCRYRHDSSSCAAGQTDHIHTLKNCSRIRPDRISDNRLDIAQAAQ